MTLEVPSFQRDLFSGNHYALRKDLAQGLWRLLWQPIRIPELQTDADLWIWPVRIEDFAFGLRTVLTPKIQIPVEGGQISAYRTFRPNYQLASEISRQLPNHPKYHPTPTSSHISDGELVVGAIPDQ